MSSEELTPVAARRKKLERLIELGIDPWGSRFDDRQLVAVPTECRRHPLNEVNRLDPPGGDALRRGMFEHRCRLDDRAGNIRFAGRLKVRKQRENISQLSPF